MLEFLLVIVFLVLLAAFFLLSPMMMNRSMVDSSRSDINVAMFKDRLLELDADLASGQTSGGEYLLLKTELERRLLDDAVNSKDPSHLTSKPSVITVVALAALIPIMAWFLYQQTGAKADWDIAKTIEQVRQNAEIGENNQKLIAQLLNQLSHRLEQRPENTDYLMMMGSTQMGLKNYLAATDAYQRLSLIYPDDSAVLAQYAQSLYLSSERVVTAKVMMVADRALAISPQQPTVLGMLGIARFEEGDYQSAIDYWQRLLPALGPVSANRKMITAGIEQAKTLLEKSGVELIEKASSVASLGPTSLKVDVAIADHIKVDKNAAVFVFARAAAGPRMPLAVARMKVSDLPASITLDDSMAMAPGLTLSSFENVEVLARISKNGIANRGPGDFEGIIGPVTVETAQDPLALVISYKVN